MEVKRGEERCREVQREVGRGWEALELVGGAYTSVVLHRVFQCTVVS